MSHPLVQRVELAERSYDIVVAAGALAGAGDFVRRRSGATHAIVIADENVLPHGETVVAALRDAIPRVDLLTVPAGEASKSISQADRLWRSLAKLRADRKSVIVAVGGGVVGDLAGFVAATFNRGMTFFQAPTTLLAQVDSGVGGKVGVNLPEGKNLVGAFWQPAGVLIDLDTLATLPTREYLSGLAEVAKYGVIADEEFFDWVEAHADELVAKDSVAVQRCVARCCRIKADVVRQDEREETGLRAILNYGHTFAHPLETLGDYGRWLHGEAVSLGMCCAARLAESLGRVDQAFVERQERTLSRLGLPTRMPPIDVDAAIAAMGSDKKVEHGRLRFVLPTRMGHVELVSNVDAELVRGALERGFDASASSAYSATK